MQLGQFSFTTVLVRCCSHNNAVFCLVRFRWIFLLRTKMKGKSLIILMLVIIRGLSGEKSDNFYYSITGKTKSELLKGGDFLPKSSFGNTSATDIENVFSRSATTRNDEVKRFMSVTSVLRMEKTVNSITFMLFTPENPAIGHFLEDEKWDTFFTSQWSLNQPLKILVHGYKGNCDRDVFATQLISAYMSSRKVWNLVCMDWQLLASEESYFDSAEHTQAAGKRLANFISYLKRAGYIRLYEAVHVIGFGLGGHLAGAAGQEIRSLQEGDLIGRITGLDPAGPGFGPTVDPENRLDPKDALFVDVIHTNMGSLPQGYLGTEIVSGHADFFPNGGSFQPSCGSSVVGDIISTCSHLESVMLFTRSIRGSKYTACKCSEWVAYIRGECDCRRAAALMGEAASKDKASGSYFLRS